MEKAPLPNCQLKEFGVSEKILNEPPDIQKASSLPLLFSEVFPKENNLYTSQTISNMFATDKRLPHTFFFLFFFLLLQALSHGESKLFASNLCQNPDLCLFILQSCVLTMRPSLSWHSLEDWNVLMVKIFPVKGKHMRKKKKKKKQDT